MSSIVLSVMTMEGQEPGRGARRPLRLVAGLFLLMMAAGASAWVLPAARPADALLGARGPAASSAPRRGGRTVGADGAFVVHAVPGSRSRRGSPVVVMGLFRGGKAPEPPPPPAKTGLFGGLLGSGKKAAAPQQGAGGKKRKLVKKRVKSSATKTNTKAQQVRMRTVYTDPAGGHIAKASRSGWI